MAEIVQPVQGLVEAWRDEFPGSALQSGNWEVRKVGVGMSYSVASSKLTIATGVTSGDVLELISKPIRIKPPVRLFVSLDPISQRIANQEFSIELVRSDTAVDVFNTDGAGIFFAGTNPNLADLKIVSQGDANSLASQATVGTGAASLFEIDLTTDEVWCYNGGPDVSATTKSNASRFTRKVPDPNATYMVRIRAKNTGTAASTTNFVIDSVLVEDYTHLGVEIARARGSSQAGEQLPVTVVGTLPAGSAAIGKVSAQAHAIWWDDSVTPLAGAATFTGTGRDLMNQSTAVATGAAQVAFPARFRGWSDSDVAGTLLAEVSRDNTTFRAVLSQPTVLIDGRYIATFDIPVYTRYARVRYVNGATIQTSFTLGSQATAVS